jgi:hypothetical protein
MDEDECGAVGGMIGRGNRSTRRKPVAIATLSNTNLKQPNLGSNPGRRGGKTAANRLSKKLLFPVQKENEAFFAVSG